MRNAGDEEPQEETDTSADAPQNDASATAAEAGGPKRQTGNGKAADGKQ